MKQAALATIARAGAAGHAPPHVGSGSREPSSARTVETYSAGLISDSISTISACGLGCWKTRFQFA